MKRLITLLLLLTPALTFSANTRYHKTLSSADGLSNSAIRCIFQNNIGHIYMGTSDGLNIWDGHSIQVFQAADGRDWFSGNLIKYLIPFGDNMLYAHTRYGIARLNMDTDEVQFFQELAHIYRLAITDDEVLICMDRKNRLYSFDLETKSLSEITTDFLPDNEYCRRMIVSKDGRLCIFTEKDTYVISLYATQSWKIEISEINNLGVGCQFVTPPGKHHDRFLYLISSDKRLMRFDSWNTSLTEITAIGNLPEDNIKGILPCPDGYYISFAQKGMQLLLHDKTDLIPTDITCGILSLAADREQPIVWIGTDCNGLIRYNLSKNNVSCLTYEQMPYPIKMPARCVLVDKERTLWFGTKGDGLYRIPDFGTGNDLQTDNMQKITTENSTLCNNSVFSISESDHDILWIGTDGNGLNYWSYKTHSIKPVPGSGHLKKVHDVIEHGLTLWVATDQNSAYRCSFVMKGDTPVITHTEPVNLSEPFNSKTSLYCMAMQNDSTIWFGSRGHGILRYDINSGQSRVLRFPTTKGLATNDTFSMTKSDRMLIATGNGLMTYSFDTDSISQSEQIPAKAVHGIVCDKDKNIFVSTNSGIISLDSTYNYRISFDRSYGMEILEYADGACFYDSVGNNTIFGGINGITIINNDIESLPDPQYMPKINITKFIQNNSHYHIDARMKKGVLKVPYSKTSFGIKFSVVDNLRYSDYEFCHKIDGHSDEWTVNDRNIIYMPTLKPGKYMLRIVYTNKAMKYRSEECILPIHITPPFYRTWWAHCLYLIIIAYGIYFIIRWNKQKQIAATEKMNKKYSDEIAKITSKTTSSINEELSVQMTFIIGLCQQIRQAVSNNHYVADKVNLVEYNVAKINKTLHIFNESKNISEILINSKATEIIAVSQTIVEIIELMKKQKTIGNVSLTHHIEDGISLALNKEAFLTMLYSLLYKALSTAIGKKCVDISVRKGKENEMIMTVKITSDKAAYDNMVSAIALNQNTFTEQEYEITFCHQLISLMNGDMDIRFDQENEIITIQISLKSTQMTSKADSSIPISDTENIYTYNTIIGNQLPKDFKNKAHLEHIYIMSGNMDISSFLGYFLSDSYNILTYSDNESLIQRMERKCPIAVIYDIYSTPSGFPEFMERIKGNVWFEQVITVALTSSLQTREREECYKQGADLCISFPFNMDYLLSMLEKKILKKQDAANYYKSAMSAYTIDEGKLISQEDKTFIDTILKTIDSNISNPNLSATMIAENLCLSTRAMYRKLEKITDKKLQSIIQEIRMAIALSLISSSNLTIEEVMLKVGYESRTTFYRNFKEIHGVTPGDYRKKHRDETSKSLSNQ